jgi:hypothetical protein
MGKGLRDAGSRYVRMLFDGGTVGGLTDGQLLERFTTRVDGSHRTLGTLPGQQIADMPDCR